MDEGEFRKKLLETLEKIEKRLSEIAENLEITGNS